MVLERRLYAEDPQRPPSGSVAGLRTELLGQVHDSGFLGLTYAGPPRKVVPARLSTARASETSEASSTQKGEHMATKKSSDEKSGKKLQIKDLTGKELDKQVVERVKGGAPKVICYSAYAKTMPW